MEQPLREELLAMRAADLSMREELERLGDLAGGYHPSMEAVHADNARRLKEVIAQFGWPGRDLVGEDGAEAAWLIVQHAIGDPPLQRAASRCCETQRRAAMRRPGKPRTWKTAFACSRAAHRCTGHSMPRTARDTPADGRRSTRSASTSGDARWASTRSTRTRMTRFLARHRSVCASTSMVTRRG